jgi:uncharacterized OsmC-like protein
LCSGVIKNRGKRLNERSNGDIIKEFTESGQLRRRQTFLVDEPENAGGEGVGPDPYTLLLAALGGCTSMTLMMYARRKNWNLEKVTIKLSQERIHSKDCLIAKLKRTVLFNASNGQSTWKAI